MEPVPVRWFPGSLPQHFLFLQLLPPGPTGKEDEFPKKPLGQLPPEPGAAVVNHVANGESHAEPAEPPRDPSPAPDRQRESRPPSRARRDSLDKPIRHHKARSRGSGEIPGEQQRLSTSTTPERGATPTSALSPTPHLATADRRKPQSHATANHNSNAASSSHRDIAPRWVKPSETKLEAGASPAPSSPDDATAALHHRRPRSKGFVPGSDRGSNASQYDNVPGLPEQDFEILELDRPPSRMRTPRSETPYSVSSLHQSSPSRGPPSLAGSVVSVSSGARIPKHPLPPFSHNSPAGIQTSYHPQTPPGTRPQAGPPPSLAFGGEQVYATTQRHPNSLSLEKALMNNSFATYRRQPPHSSAHNPPRSVRPPPEPSLQRETQGSSTPIYLQQLTSPTQVYSSPVDYRFEGHRRGEANLHYLPEGGPLRRAAEGPMWGPEDERPPQSPGGGVPRSPSFQKAQMSPVQEFTFPSNNPDGLLQYRTQFQEQQPVIRQQLPQLFGGPHYRHAQEAFALQESMLL
ncbi:hypothetical protein INR49_001701 [Caranx melampygus]|nr:hypothetical protein INR49_001701 [Caranx melampygus]